VDALYIQAALKSTVVVTRGDLRDCPVFGECVKVVIIPRVAIVTTCPSIGFAGIIIVPVAKVVAVVDIRYFVEFAMVALNPVAGAITSTFGIIKSRRFLNHSTHT